MNRRIFILLHVLVWIFAESPLKACENIRLDKDPNVLGLVPAWQQGKNSGCYAYAAAQLIDAERFSRGDKDRAFTTDPMILGVQSGDLLVGGGNVEDSLWHARSSGVCSSKDVSRFLGTEAGDELLKFLANHYAIARGKKLNADFVGTFTSGSKAAYFSEDIPTLGENRDFNFEHSPVTSAHRGKNNGRIQTQKKTAPPVEYSETEKKAATEICQHLAGLNLESELGINGILEFLKQSRSKFLDHILSSACKNKKNLSYLPFPTVRDFYMSDTGLKYRWPPTDRARIDGLRNAIAGKLSTKKPVAIEFCNEVVTNPKHKGRYDEHGHWVCQSNGQHAAVIVGSKKNLIGGGCSYLVRDSYCSHYPKQWYMDTCSGGEYWISSDQLLNNTRAAIFY